MADSKLFALLSLLLLFSVVFNDVVSEAQDSQVIEEVRSDGSDDSSTLKVEFEQLKSKIQLLETHLDESNGKLKAKDEKILQSEKVIQEKSDTVATLQSEIENIQKKGTSDAEERVGKAHARASELQKQVEKLKKEIEGQNNEKDALEVRAKVSAKQIEELSSKLEKLQEINDEQKTRIRKTERALQVAEEEMMKAKLEATSRTKELMESFIEAEWNEHGTPIMEVLVQKTREKKDQAEKWAEPHIEIIKTKWVPAVKGQWLMVTEYVEPHMKSLTAKSADVYEASKSAVKPHIIKIQKLADPYYQEAKKFSKPYIDQVATVAKPHVEKARIALKPYTKKAVHVYEKFLESATTYHHQVQAALHEKLKQHEVTRPLATKELIWFVASALLALPVIILYRVCSAMFCKKSKKPARNSNAHHARRKGKRGHPDK